jgi:hypothetical protein
MQLKCHNNRTNDRTKAQLCARFHSRVVNGALLLQADHSGGAERFDSLQRRRQNMCVTATHPKVSRVPISPKTDFASRVDEEHITDPIPPGSDIPRELLGGWGHREMPDLTAASNCLGITPALSKLKSMPFDELI